MTLQQTITGLNTSNQYGLSFWVSGENAATRLYSDGIFGLDVTGFSTTYLTVPSGTSALGASHVYRFEFVPTNSTTTITFTNWGHFYDAQTTGWTINVFTTELVLDDVILNDLGPVRPAGGVPEPFTATLAGMALAVVALAGTRRRSKRPD